MPTTSSSGSCATRASRSSTRSSCPTPRRSSQARFRRRRVLRRCCCMGTTTSSRLATRRSGSRHRSRRPSATARSTVAGRRLQVEHSHARRGAASLGWQAAGRDQARDRRPGGGRQRAHHLRARASRAVRLRRDGDRRHGEPPSRRTDTHGCPTGHRGANDRSQNTRRTQAQRPVRRRCPRRADRAPACARDAARRARQRRGAGTSP